MSSAANVDRGPAFLGVALAFAATALLFVGLRIFVRVRMIHCTGLDDYLIVLAMALSIITAAFNIVEYKAGFGRHVEFLTPTQVMRASEYAVLSETMFILSLMFSKISICVFLLRLLADSLAKKRKYFLYFWIALLFVVNIICVGQQLGQCRPTRRLWDPMVPGKCEDPRVQSDFGYLNGAVAAGADFSLAAFPISFIKGLHMSVGRRVALACLMAVGVFAGACAIIRTLLESSLSSRNDPTWYLVDAAIWALVETNVSIIAACVPTLLPIFRSAANLITGVKKGHQHLNKGFKIHHNSSPETKSAATQPATPRSPTVETDDSSYEMGRLPRHILPSRKADLEDDASSEKDFGDATSERNFVIASSQGNFVVGTEPRRIRKTTSIDVFSSDKPV